MFSIASIGLADEFDFEPPDELLDERDFGLLDDRDFGRLDERDDDERDFVALAVAAGLAADERDFAFGRDLDFL